MSETLKAQGLRVHTLHSNSSGVIYLYECPINKCPIEIRVLDYKNGGETVAEIVENSQHKHHIEDVKSEKLQRILKSSWVYQIYDQNAQPTSILEEILKKDKDIKIDNSKNFLNMLSKRKERFQARMMKRYSIVNTHDIEEFVRETAPPKNRIEMMILGSRSLLENLIRQQRSDSPYFSIDATYKLTTSRYPLIIVGTQDRLHRFQLVALMISSEETEAA